MTYSLLLRDELRRKKHLTIEKLNLIFCRRAVVCPILSKRRSNNRVVERHGNPISLNRQKISNRSRYISKKRVRRVRS